MFSNVNFNPGYYLNQYSGDIENLSKYALGTNIVTPDEGPFTGMGLMLGLGAITETGRGISWLRKTYRGPIPEGLEGKALKAARKAASPFRNGNYGWLKGDNYKLAGERIKAGWAQGIGTFKADLATKKGMFSNGGWHKLNTYKTGWNNYSANKIIESIPKDEKFKSMSEKTQALYKEAEEAAKLAKNANPTEARASIKIANKAFAKAEAEAASILINNKPTTFWGKIAHGLGLRRANAAVKGLAAESPILAKGVKFASDNKGFAALSVGIELVTKIIPTFNQLGVVSGLWQTGKSAANIGASLGGFGLGMKIGGAIGTCFGPGPGTIIGTAIGGLCGFVGGCLGSWAAGKATEKIIGKDELELAKEEQAKKTAEEAAKNPEVAQKLMTDVQQKLETEGINSEDAKIAYGSMQNLARLSQNPWQAQMQSQSAPSVTDYEQAQAQSQYVPQITGNKQAQAQYSQANTSFSGNMGTNPFAVNTSAYNMLNKKDIADEDFMAVCAGINT